MRYIVRTSYVDVIGDIWQPGVGTCAMRYPVSGYDIENMRGDDGTITREDVEDWIGCHSGDFSNIEDFTASIEDGDTTLDFPWSSEDSEITYIDCMYNED